MRYAAFSISIVLCCSAVALLAQQSSSSRYVVTWVGDADRADSDFLAVVDVALGSKTYGQIINTVPAGAIKTIPHHTEQYFFPGHPLFANGYAGNATFRFDLSDPVHPRLMGKLSEVPDLAYPHSFARLPNGNVLATMQAKGDDFLPPGGLAEFRDDGSVVRSASAANDVDPLVRLYNALVLPEKDRLIVSGGLMTMNDPRGAKRPNDHSGFTVQLWRLSDLRLLKTIALPPAPGSRPTANQDPYEPRLLKNGEVMLTTGYGGLYHVTGFDADTFKADFVFDFGGSSGVPVIVDRFWIQPVSGLRRVVAVDVSNPAKPVELSRIQFDDRQVAHWLSADPFSDRIIMANSSGEPRLWMLKFDPISGLVSIDTTFHEPGDDRHPGISFDHEVWPHGKTGTGVPHGSVFVN